jgi:hypothetical protein
MITNIEIAITCFILGFIFLILGIYIIGIIFILLGIYFLLKKTPSTSNLNNDIQTFNNLSSNTVIPTLSGQCGQGPANTIINQSCPSGS